MTGRIMSQRDRNNSSLRGGGFMLCFSDETIYVKKLSWTLKNGKDFSQQRWWQDVLDRSGPSKKGSNKGNHTGFRALEIQPLWFLCRVSLNKWNKLRLNKNIKSKRGRKLNIKYKLYPYSSKYFKTTKSF